MGNQQVFAVNIFAELQNVKSFTQTRISKPDFARIYPSYPRHFATLHIWLQVQEVSSVADNKQLLIINFVRVQQLQKGTTRIEHYEHDDISNYASSCHSLVFKQHHQHHPVRFCKLRLCRSTF